MRIYHSKGFSSPKKGQAQSKADKDAENRQKQFVYEIKKRQPMPVNLRKIGYKDMIDKRVDTYIPSLKKDERESNEETILDF